MNFKGIAKFVAGVDVDEAVRENPFLDEAKSLDIQNPVIPYDDNTFDIVFSNSVLEHVQDPETVFTEVRRVLKPGGLFLAKTPNKWHYVAVIARMTPDGFHEFYNRLRGRKVEDTFPTVYRCNTKSAVIRYANKLNFEIKDIKRVEGRPEYLRLTSPTYFSGFLYERLVNLTECLAAFRCVILFELAKKS